MPSNANAVVTLVSAHQSPVVDEPLIAKIVKLCKGTETKILAENIAADIFCVIDNLSATENNVRTLIGEMAVDIVVQRLEGREKKLLIADMDSTIIQQECLDELAGFAGFKDKVSAITERAMRGELNFDSALRERVAMLKDLPLQALEDTLARKITLTSGAVELVETMNARGAMTALVSGGFTFFTHRIAQATGFQDNQGNILGVDGDKLDGTVEDPILGKEAKREALMRLCEDESISPIQSMAVGDGANDLMMIEAAGSGVAFHAKPAVAEMAKIRINYSDLTALLYIQGIKKSEFKTREFIRRS